MITKAKGVMTHSCTKCGLEWFTHNLKTGKIKVVNASLTWEQINGELHCSKCLED